MNTSQENEIGTGFQPSEPVLCANGCGFFGAASTMGLCSKCYRDSRIEEERAASANAVVEKFVRSGEVRSAEVREEKVMATTSAEAEVDKKAAAISNRCLSCNKKVGVMSFQCRCGGTFCGVHRYPEKHCCTFDFKRQGKDSITRANPVIKADKINRI